MRKVILIYPKIEYEDNYPCSWIPYSILALGSSLKNIGIDVLLFDQNKDELDILEKALENKEIIAVGISVMTGGGQISNAIELTKMIKMRRPKCVVFWGGPHVNVFPEQTVSHPLVDIAMKGVGQNAVCQLIYEISSGKSYNSVDGCYYKENNMIRSSLGEAKIKQLTAYDFSLLDIEKYVQHDNTIANRTINYISSQGCPYSCRFCYETNYKRKYYKMPFDLVEKDIRMFVEKYNINGIKFYDADFFVDIKQALSIAGLMKLYNLKWAASIHPNDILRAEKNGENELLKKVLESGCTRLLMGVESGNDRVLKQIVNKRVTKEKIYFVASRIADYGILGSYTFIVGFPGETENEQKDTFNFIRSLWKLSPKPETRVHIYTPYPGTPLYDEALKRGFCEPKNLEEWSDFDYYKAMVPWTNKKLEFEVKHFTEMIEKRGNYE